MAIITRGKRKGEKVKISQMSNDWISLTDGSVMNPTSLEFTPLELMRLKTDKAPGVFWGLYEIKGFRLKKKTLHNKGDRG